MKKNYMILILVILLGMCFQNAFSTNNYLNENFSTSVTLSPTNVDGTWYPDRYLPAGFASNSGHLEISISGADGAQLRPSGYGGAFYNTQGRKFNQGGLSVKSVKADLYIPSDWETKHRRSDIWSTALDISNVISYYPIIGFANLDGSSPMLRYWNSSGSGSWVTITTTITYDSWYTFEMVLVGSDIVYKVNGTTVGTLDSEGSTNFDNIIMQAYNFNDNTLGSIYDGSSNNSYTAVWDNLITTGPVYNVTQNTYYNTIQAAISDADAGDEIEVAEGTYLFTSQMNIDKNGISIEGLGNVIFKADNAAWSTVNGYKHLIGIIAGTETYPVKISNITMNCNSQCYGLNTYNNAYGNLDDVTINGSKGAGLTVNGSTINATNLNTSANAWGAVNVDPGSGVTTPSVFTLNSGTLAESNKIWSDGKYVTGSATVTVNAIGFDYVVKNTSTPNPLKTYYQTTKESALAFAVALASPQLSSVKQISNGQYWVGTGMKIQTAIDAASAGNTINVLAGTFNEDVNINKTLSLKGAGFANTTVVGPIGGGGATMQVAAANVVIDGFLITRAGNNVTDWNNGGLNSAGIAIQSQGNYAEIKNCKITGMRTAIDINNSNGNNIHDNIIDNNRTGFIFRNQTDNTICVDNDITNNWTVGVLFLDASGGTNVPVQSALNSTFNSNNISGNWYGQIVDRQVGGSLPPAGSNMKNFECNWYGSTNPVYSVANSTEPGYSALIPVIYGGTAVAPGNQPDILGLAAANFDYVSYLTSAGGACDGVLPVHNLTKDTWYLTIQSAIDAASAGNTITVAPGNYYETASGRSVFGTGSYQFGLYIDKDNLTIKGIKADGSDVLNYNDATAFITTNSTANFGPSGVFVQASGLTLQGLKIGDNIVNGNVSSNKTIEVVGDNFTLQYCNISTSSDQGAVYFGEWDQDHQISSYNLYKNKFENTLISVNNGVGTTGARTGRLIFNNDFEGYITPYLISFRGWNGPNPAQGWILYPVGGAVIGNNKFNNPIVGDYISTRGNTGGVIESEVNFNEIWTSNIFGNRAVTLSYEPTFVVRSYNNGTYPVTRRISSKIQENIDIAQSGDAIKVGSGTYAEDIIVNKALDIRGPNYGITPNGGTRVAEAIIHPATSNPDINTGGQIMYLENSASGSTISGFTFDGDNPLLTSGVIMNGKDIDVLEAISGYHGLSNITVQNNIIQNLNYTGIDFYNYYNSGTATTGNTISDNLFDNIIPTQYGIAILIYNNCYTNITNNVMTRVRVGVQTGNYYQADPGNSRSISNNIIEASRRGIFHNLAYSNASVFTLSNNTINASSIGLGTEWDGILLSSLSVSSNSLNNTITGPTASVNSQGYEIWNVKNTTPALISGGTVSGVDYGVFANNFEGYNGDGGDGAHATLSSITITPKSAGTGIYVKDSPSSTTHANVQVTVGSGVSISGGANGVVIENANAKLNTPVGNLALTSQTADYIKLINNANDIDATSVSFAGKVGSAMTLLELLAVENKITHKYDNPALGLVTINTTDNAVVSLNFNYSSPVWIDNNTSNTNATVPGGGSAPTLNIPDANFNGYTSVTFGGGTNILSIPYNNNVARVNGNTSKTLFTYFRTGTDIASRQVIFEAGGINSGFNVYVYNGKLYMGAWSSSARRFFYQTAAPNTNYLVSVEYGSSKVRVSVNGVVSGYLTFTGFTSESGENGVGGSYNRTRYMDNISAAGIYHTFKGNIAEVLCYNTNDLTFRHSLVGYFDAKYGTSFGTPYSGKMIADNSIDSYVWDEGDVEFLTETGLSVSTNGDNLVAKYSTYEPKAGKLALYDVNGLVVKAIYNGDFNKGESIFNVETSGISSGVYFMVVETGFGIESKKVFIVK